MRRTRRGHKQLYDRVVARGPLILKNRDNEVLRKARIAQLKGLPLGYKLMGKAGKRLENRSLVLLWGPGQEDEAKEMARRMGGSQEDGVKPIRRTARRGQ